MVIGTFNVPPGEVLPAIEKVDARDTSKLQLGDPSVARLMEADVWPTKKTDGDDGLARDSVASKVVPNTGSPRLPTAGRPALPGQAEPYGLRLAGTDPKSSPKS